MFRKRHTTSRTIIVNHIHTEPPKETKKGRNLGSLADWVAILVSIGVGIVTLFLFNETKKATQSATDSANAAISAFREQRHRDSLDSVEDKDKELRARIQFTDDSMNSRKQFGLDSQGTQVQINTLVRTEKQWQIEHKAFLTIKGLQILKFDPNEKTIVHMETENVGSEPAVIDSSGYGLYIFKDSIIGGGVIGRTNCLNTVKENIIYNPLYIDKSSSNDGFASLNPPTPKQYDRVVKEGEHLFVGGILKYRNLVTGHKSVFEFYAMIIPQGNSILNSGTFALRYLRNQ